VTKGLLLAPEELQKYDAIVPGAARRILAMAERDHGLAYTAFCNDMLGLVAAWVIALVALSGAIYTATIGAHWSIPVALAGFPIASIIGAVRARKTDGRTTATDRRY
jgi:uncharacterized membrane protein